MVLALAAGAIAQHRGFIFANGVMFGVIGFTLLDRFFESKAVERAHREHAGHLALIMKEMRLTFTAQHEAVEAARTEATHYRRLYLQKVNGR
jgi:hypothetical protein